MGRSGRTAGAILKGVYLSLGSNMGDRHRSLQRALEELIANGVAIEQVSSIYESEPQGGPEQGLFFNIAVAASTFLFPAQLLARIQKIERKLKRPRGILNGPRTIDIDIVFFGQIVMQTADLQIPHPRYASRRFVLDPLSELSPDLRDPKTGRSVSELLATVSDQMVKRLSAALVLGPGARQLPRKFG
jgi:2-amino-4-hydroxy-6-hydroxymethyldihydropteridine diphosphokinase